MGLNEVRRALALAAFWGGELAGLVGCARLSWIVLVYLP